MENWREKEKESADLEGKRKRKWTTGGKKKEKSGELEGKREKVENWRGFFFLKSG